MCEPATLTAIGSLAATAGSAYFQYQGQRAQGRAAQAEAEYRAAVDRNNATRAEYLAEDAIERGKEAERDERLRGRLLIGQMRAALASSGQVVDSGSAGELVVDQSQTNELNSRTVRNNAAREAQDFRIRASQFDTSANLTQIGGENSRRRANNEATGTLLGGASRVATKWYQFSEAGVFA